MLEEAYADLVLIWSMQLWILSLYKFKILVLAPYIKSRV